MKLTIDVTQEDIDLGCRYDTSGAKGGCMVHKAFNRCTEGSFPFFEVEYTEIRIFNSMESMQDGFISELEIDLPEFVEDKIRDFDLGEPVQPFSFEVDIPIGNEVGRNGEGR